METVIQVNQVFIRQTMKNSKQEFRYPKSQSLSRSMAKNILAAQEQRAELQRSLEKLIMLSTKTNDPSVFLKQELFQMNKMSYLLRDKKKQHRLFMKKQTIKHLQRMHQKFFVPSLEGSSKDSINKIGQQAIAKPEVSFSFWEDEKQQQPSYNSLSPLSSLKITKYQNEQRQMLNKISVSIDSSRQLSPKRAKNFLFSSNYKETIRRSNTFLFSLPTMQGPKKRPSAPPQETVYPWEQNLLENMNHIQEISIKVKGHLKVQKQRLSSFLKKHFMHEIITTYYKCEGLVTFAAMRAVVCDLMKLSRRQASLIAFLTYDFNNDGFICEEDIYFFISKLPFDAKIMQDFNLVIQFFRTNKVRSSESNLPKKLLQRKQKAVAKELLNETPPALKSLRSKQKQKIVRKFYTLFDDTSEQTPSQKKIPFYKKFQINFEVFNLIFAEKRPVLVSEIINKLIERPAQPDINRIVDEVFNLHSRTEPTEQFLYTRSQSWKKMMQNSQKLRSVARVEKDKFSRIIE